ncbi:hypothetical protein [Streptomyces monashensis]|uniref:DUF485 domain-containing protein n=1 Tax=Streptomyces monashensis TaxID=1678012 RepID=A0A1S2PYV1_9ACTN|nr:hypothetical protein [Streptomyces monashensis]OIJ98545.1 hypothetical protein BIV23_29805 [Streptomyces monashensis]
MGAEPVPRREVVTARHPGHSDRAAPRPRVSSDARPAAPRHDAATRHVMRHQLRAALLVTALLAGLLGLLPVLLRLLPLATTAPRVPLAVWLVLGVAPYPALLAIGAWYVRRAERNETGPAARLRPERP